MKFLDLLMEKLGYTKKQGQIDLNVKEPNFYPENAKIPPESEDKDKLLTYQNTPNTISTPPINGRPENLVGEPRILTPNQDIKRNQEESLQVLPTGPAVKPMVLDHTMPSNQSGNGIEERNLTPYTFKSDDANYDIPKQIASRAIMGFNDVHEICPYIAEKMEKKGIKFVDKELFFEKYYDACKKSALKRLPLSEYLDGKDE